MDSPRLVPTGAAEQALASRRRALRTGLGSTAVLMTLVSRPVLGAQCAPPSGYDSLAGSNAAKQINVCTGLSPDAWSSGTSWPSPYYANNTGTASATLYHGTTTGLSGTTFAPHTMLWVLGRPDDNGIVTFGRYTAAALLNAKSGRTPALTETAVRGIWNDYLLNGSYSPTATIVWDLAKIIQYLKSTIG
jgi:hypothetical protein